jgi:hypothetical protein
MPSNADVFRNTEIFGFLLSMGGQLDGRRAADAKRAGWTDANIAEFNSTLQADRQSTGAQTLGDSIREGLSQSGFNVAKTQENGTTVSTITRSPSKVISTTNNLKKSNPVKKPKPK